MEIFLLEECHECAAIIIAEKTTRKEIQEIVNVIKKEHSHTYELDDIAKALPSDCKFYNRYGSDNVNIIYC